MVSKAKIKVNDISYHCAIGFLVRILFVLYGFLQDKYMDIPYTDVDYKVFSQAAKEVVAQRSPYNVPTFRYSPIFAYLMTPSVLHPDYGKVVAVIFDTYLAYRIYQLILLIYNSKQKALQCAQLWLYNPLPIIISTRGNLDSVSSVFILLSVLYHLKQNPITSGALLGFCIHLRLYPVIFVLPFVISAGRFSKEDTLKRTYIPKIQFIGTCAATLVAVTLFFHYVYGPKFTTNCILYHIFREDIRHNFSLYYYVQYLSSVVPDYISNNFTVVTPATIKNLLTIVPCVICLLAVFVKYNTLNHLSFAIFCSTYIFVIFNRVVTCQYHIWYLSLLPVFLPSIIIGNKKLAVVLGLWLAGHGLWLIPAYYLEFKGLDTYSFIHAACLLVYLINVWILATFIQAYNNMTAKKVA